MKQAILIRHGSTAANEQRLYCGRTDVPLSETGRRELIRLRRDAIWPDTDGVRIYTSGMLRTEETLALLLGECPHTVESAFREMDFGIFELRRYEELRTDRFYQTWIDGENEQNRCPGGENGEEMSKRVLTAFWQSVSSDSVLIISHGGPIAAIMATVFPEQGWNRWQWQPNHGTGYRIIWPIFPEKPIWERCPSPTVPKSRRRNDTGLPHLSQI